MEGCKTIAIPLESNKALQKEDGSPKANQTKFRSLIGSLLYLTTTREDIMYAACLLSRFMQIPTHVHYGVAKRKQATVAQSSTEAEYIAVALTTSHVIWLKRIFEDMGKPQKEAT
ncbi:hypothetical protein UlMin_024206 [Ulmus minor]